MTDQTPEAITLHTTIAETDRIRHMEPVVVKRSDSLQHAAEVAVQNTGCRVLAVVGDDDRLVGVLPVRVLVNDIFLKLVPEEFLGEILDYEAVLKYAQHVGARTCADVMSGALSVRGTDTVRDAFERMHAAKLNGLPVVDDKLHVVGYVDQLELLLIWVEASGRKKLLQPPIGDDS